LSQSIFYGDTKMPVTGAGEPAGDSAVRSITRFGDAAAIHSDSFLSHPAFQTRRGFANTPVIGPGAEQIITVTGDFAAQTEQNVKFKVQGNYTSVTGQKFDKSVGKTSPAISILTVKGIATTLYKKPVTSYIHVRQHVKQDMNHVMTIGNQVIVHTGNRELKVYGTDSKVYVGDKAITTHGNVVTTVRGLEKSAVRRSFSSSAIFGTNVDSFLGGRLEYVEGAQYNSNMGLNLILHNVFRGIQICGASAVVMGYDTNLLGKAMEAVHVGTGAFRARMGAISARIGVALGLWRIP
jgi:hypothetical protein